MFKLPTYQELERAAHEAHTSMRQVCLRAGVSATIYYKWRSGTGSPTLKSLQKVLDVLNELSAQ